MIPFPTWNGEQQCAFGIRDVVANRIRLVASDSRVLISRHITWRSLVCFVFIQDREIEVFDEDIRDRMFRV